AFLDNENEILLSAVTGFEIAVKYLLGKLSLAEPPQQFIDKRIKANALTPLPVTFAHTMLLADLPFHHGDPFDRLLVAQSLSERTPILSAESQLSAYGIHRIW
ncbi:MAG: type II toxin-antitoxin system VapC family toxin, partial [Methylococcales bacterium]